MARPLRLEYPGSISHITSRGNERRNTYSDDYDRRLFLALLEEAVDRFDWIVLVYVLMSNHFHFVVELTRETLSLGMQWLNGRYAQAFNRRHRRAGHLFHHPFDSVLLDKESHFLEVLRYDVLNPVRAKMVAHPIEYEWSSYRATVGHSPAPAWLAVDRVLANFASEPGLASLEYQRFVEAGIGDERRPWDDVVGQIYLGRESWIERVKEQIDKKPRSDEHPAAQRNPIKPSMSTVVASVAGALGITEDEVRHARGGTARTLAAWLACHEAFLDLRAIAAGLRLRSAGHVSELIALGERRIREDASLQDSVIRCTEVLRSTARSETENRSFNPIFRN